MNTERSIISRAAKARQRGNAMVELALTMSAFFLLTLGAMDFSWAIYAQNFCSYAAQDAARWASVHGSQSSSPAAVEDMRAFVQNEGVGLNPGGITVTTCWSNSCPNTGLPPTGYNAPGSTVQVTVQYQIQPLAGIGFTQTINTSSTGQYLISH